MVIVPMLLSAAFPAPSGYVNDFASALDGSAEQYLEGFLATLERDTTAEVVVATVSSLEGMTVEEYANRLFAEWGIGQAADDNGVLLLVAPGERSVRIEVGYGLEPILPDGLAGEIIRTEILPEFRAGNIPRGIGRGLNRIAQDRPRRSAGGRESGVPEPGEQPSARVVHHPVLRHVRRVWVLRGGPRHENEDLRTPGGRRDVRWHSVSDCPHGDVGPLDRRSRSDWRRGAGSGLPARTLGILDRYAAQGPARFRQRR